MPALSARDAEGILRFVAAAEGLGGDDEPFTPHVLEELGKLVTADWVAYCEQDRIRQHVRLFVGRASDEYELDEPLVSYWDIAEEHPVCRVHHTGESRALKLSDFVGLRQLKSSHVYAVWFGPCGIDRELNVAIPSPPWHTKTFLFDRGRGRDFTERDRLVLDRLQPHLARLWRTAQTRRRLRAALAALEWEDEHEARGVVCLASGGEVELSSPAAGRLLREYFGASRAGQLPAEVGNWLQTGSATLHRRRAKRRLTIQRAGELLLLEETRDGLGLTGRELQIVAWVARGKTNAQIAELLWISPTTVRKHLENVYTKLGVRTRTAAAARFLGTLDEIEEEGTA